MTYARLLNQESKSEMKPTIEDADVWTTVSEKICFARSFIDNTILIGDSIDFFFGLAPQILSFSPYALGIGCATAVILAAFEAYCHKINCQVNQNTALPPIDEKELKGICLPLKYKIPLAVHFGADMTDFAGGATALAKYLGYTSATSNIAFKVVGGIIGGLYSVGETRNIYQSFRRLAFWNRAKETAEVDSALAMQQRI